MRTLYGLALVLSLILGSVVYADSITYTQPNTRTDGSPLGDDLASSVAEIFDSTGALVGQTMVFPAEIPNTGQEVTQPLENGLLQPGETYTAQMVWVDTLGQQSVPDVFEFTVPTPAAPSPGGIKRITIEFANGVVQTIETP